MTRPLLPPDVELARRDRQDRERISRLGRSDRLGDSSQQGGAHQLLAPDGSVLFAFGDFDDAEDTERYGLALYDGAGNIVLNLDEEKEGLVFPGHQVAWGTTNPTEVTSPTFADYWSTALVAPNGDAVYSQGALTCDAGTTGTARIRVAYAGDPTAYYTNNVTLNDTVSTFVFNWLHDIPIGQPLPGATIPINALYLEVRRTGGAGNVYAYRPRLVWVGSSRILAGGAALGSALSMV